MKSSLKAGLSAPRTFVVALDRLKAKAAKRSAIVG
jgi:hypothetical protein